MPWLDLGTEVAEEFALLPTVGRVRRDDHLRVFKHHTMPASYWADRYQRRTRTVIGEPQVCFACGATYRHNLRQLLHSQARPRTCGKKVCAGRAKARLIAAHGQARTVLQWAEATGLNAETIRWRLRAGWEPARAVQP